MKTQELAQAEDLAIAVCFLRYKIRSPLTRRAATKFHLTKMQLSLNKFPSVLASLGAVLLAGAAAASPVYSITEITPPGPWFTGVAINDSGQVVGNGPVEPNGPTHALLYSRGKVTDLGMLPGANVSVVTGINRKGQVVGYSGVEETPNSGSYSMLRAFLYTNGSMQDLGTLGGTYAYAEAINDDGVVVGSAYTASDDCAQAFVYRNGVMSPVGTCQTTLRAFLLNKRGNITGITPRDGNGRFHTFFSKNGSSVIDIGCLDSVPNPGNCYTEPAAISDNGHITGFSRNSTGGNRPYLYQNGVMRDLGSLGGNNGSGLAVNASGTVTGYSTIANGYDHAFVYKKGVMRDLDPTGIADISFGTNINNEGDIFGFGLTFEPFEFFAFIYTEGRMRKLGELISQRSPLKGVVQLSYINKITENGYILATGTNTLTGLETSYILKAKDDQD